MDKHKELHIVEYTPIDKFKKINKILVMEPSKIGSSVYFSGLLNLKSQNTNQIPIIQTKINIPNSISKKIKYLFNYRFYEINIYKLHYEFKENPE